MNAKILLSILCIGFLGFMAIPKQGLLSPVSATDELISPIAAVQLSPLPTETPAPTPADWDVVAKEIIDVFKPEGIQVTAKALNCFKNESGWRERAVGVNTHKDGTKSRDRGVAQISEKWHPDVSDLQAFNYKENIRYAYQMYKNRGNFSAWYAPGCNS